MITIEVGLGSRSYPVVVGRGANRELPDRIPAVAKRAAVITQSSIPVTIDPGIEHQVFDMPDGEAAKSLATVEDLCRRLSSWGLTRGDVVIGLGGGVVTDVAGFVAAVYHRGLPVIHVSTTLLGQIDAALGGKTGVNLPEGKNLVGAFWQPSAVLCDTTALDTLPAAEMRCGMGEMAKYQLLGGTDLLALDLETQVASCVQIKADIVAADEREAGPRAVLNYGHTLAHALETAGGFGLRHGEAVAVGLIYAAELARHLGRIDAGRVAAHRDVVAGFGLDASLPVAVADDEIVELFGRDKKAVDGLTFVLDGPSGIEPVGGIDPADARQALASMRAGEGSPS